MEFPSPTRTQGLCPTPPQPVSSVQTERLASIDALRGFSIFWIIGGDDVVRSLARILTDKGPLLGALGDILGTQIEHVEWEGFRFYDFVFPLFVFVAGLAIPFAQTRLVEREGRLAAHKRVLRRAALLFVLGLVYNGGLSHPWPEIRLMGVLQRIALAYLAASLLFLNLGRRGLIVACGGLLVGYWALMTFVPVPGIGAGSFESGANLANWLDWRFLPGELFVETWDPEGLLSTLPAVGTCLLGIFAGLLLKDPDLEAKQKSLWLAAGGLMSVAVGLLWSLQFPIIKNIWTSSFVLVAGGYSALLLSVFHYVMDVRGQRRWATIFVWIGANAITLYLLNNVTSFRKIAERLAGSDLARFLNEHLTPGAGSLLVNIVATALPIVVAAFFYRRRIFIRV